MLFIVIMCFLAHMQLVILHKELDHGCDREFITKIICETVSRALHLTNYSLFLSLQSCKETKHVVENVVTKRNLNIEM